MDTTNQMTPEARRDEKSMPKLKGSAQDRRVCGARPQAARFVAGRRQKAFVLTAAFTLAVGAGLATAVPQLVLAEEPAAVVAGADAGANAGASAEAPELRSQSTTQMQSAPEVVNINAVTDATERAINFNNNWKFVMGDPAGADGASFNDSTWQTLNLPHDYSIDQEYTGSGEAESGYKLGGIGWYRKSFEVDKALSGKSFRMDFDGVYMDATVWINGHKLANHPYGYAPFSLDLTKYINFGGANVVAVRVNHQVPSSRWYSGSGIGRDVDLVVTDAVHVAKDGVVVRTPKIAEGSGATELTSTVANDSDAEKNVEVVSTILDASGAPVGSASASGTVGAGATSELKTTVDVANPKLWDLSETPALYTARTEVKLDGKVVDTTESSFGYRSIAFDAQGFKLNGKRVKLKGMSMHHDQGALGSTSARDAIERQVLILKNMGVNAIRATHNPYSREFIDICNKHGMLVIEEFFDGWNRPKNGNTYDYARFFEKQVGDNALVGATADMTWAQFDLQSSLKRDINAPAVIMWSLGNEVREGAGGKLPNEAGVQANLVKWTQELDTTRPVTQGDNNIKNSNGSSISAGIANAGGIVGLNYCGAGQYDSIHSAFPNWLLYGSETASAVNSRGVYNVTGSQQLNSDKLLTSYDTSAVGWGARASEAWFDVINRDFVAGEFVWTGFDYIGEPTPNNGIGSGWVNGTDSPKNSFFGVVDTAGLPKDSFYFYQSQWNDAVHTLHVLPAWSNDPNVVKKDGRGNINVVVYTDAPGAKLVLVSPDGIEREVGAPKYFKTVTTPAGFTYQVDKDNPNSDRGLYFSWSVPYADGTLKAVALDADGTPIDSSDTAAWQGRQSVSTFGRATHLEAEVTYNKDGMHANGSDLAYLTVSVLDDKNNVVANSKQNVKFEVTGAGTLAGVDNGVQPDMQSYRDDNRKAQAGQLVGIVRAGTTAGTVKVTVSADGLASDTVEIPVTAASDGAAEQQKLVSSVFFSRYYYVKTGTELTLPEQLEVRYTDGATQMEPVTWDSVPEGALDAAGTFQLAGKVAGTPISVNVQVLDKVAALLNYSCATQPGVAPILPDARPAVLADGSVLNASFPVTWDAPTDASAYAKPGGTIEVKGTANVFGVDYPVSATVRVQEETLRPSGNIAPEAMSLTQDEATAANPSDTLKAIIDKNTAIADNNSGGANPSCWSNWAFAQAGGTQSALTLEYATQQRAGSLTAYFATDSGSGRLPSDVALEVSEDGQTWTPVTTKLTRGTTNGRVTPFTLDFAPTLGTFWRVTVTNATEPTGTRWKPCTMITELELNKVEGTFETHAEPKLASLTVNGEEVPEAALAAGEYNTPAIVATVVPTPADNTAVTVLPAQDDALIVLLESEDHSKLTRFTVRLNQERTLTPSDPAQDIPTDNMDMSTGSEQPNYGDFEGPVDFSIDGDPNTHYHSKWQPTTIDDLWVETDLGEPKNIEALRYQPRQNGVNGTPTEYSVEYYDNASQSWVEVAHGTADPADKNWQVANFSEPVLAQRFRLRAIHTYADSGNDRFFSLSEVRLREVAPKTSIAGATLSAPDKLEVDEVSAEKPAVFDPTEVTVTLNPATRRARMMLRSAAPAADSTATDGADTTGTDTTSSDSTTDNTATAGTTLRYGIDYVLEYANNTALGTATLTARGIDAYEDSVSANFEVVEKPATLEGISVTTQPTKQLYSAGEKFNPAGLVITKAMSNGESEEVAYSANNADAFKFENTDFTEADTYDVTVTYEGKTATFTVTVQPAPEPETPEPETPDLTTPDNPDTGSVENPDTGTTENPDTTDNSNPDTTNNGGTTSTNEGTVDSTSNGSGDNTGGSAKTGTASSINQKPSIPATKSGVPTTADTTTAPVLAVLSGIFFSVLGLVFKKRRNQLEIQLQSSSG